MKKIIVLAMALVLGLTINAMASATYILNVPNDDISPYPGPYASITVDLTSTNIATITAEAYPGYQFGGAQGVDLNTTGGSATASNFSDTSYFQQTNPLPQNVSEFGLFDVIVEAKAPGGFPSSVDLLTFTLTNTSTTDWLTASDVLALNNKDYLAAAHIYVLNSKGNGALATGFAANGPTSVPEPGMMLLFGSGMAAIAAAYRKFKG